MDTSRLQQNLEQKNAITAENHAFIKEVTLLDIITHLSSSRTFLMIIFLFMCVAFLRVFWIRIRPDQILFGLKDPDPDPDPDPPFFHTKL